MGGRGPDGGPIASPEHELAQRFVAARRADADTVVLEGYHAIKHAVRFGASLRDVVVRDGTVPDDLPPELDGVDRTTADGDLFSRLVPSEPPVPVVAIAQRPAIDLAAVLGGPGDLVLLERPTHPGNAGAVVRVAAAAGCAGVLTEGGVDPWGPAALRGGAGLQFALPVVAVPRLPATDRPVVAFDADGVALGEAEVPADAILAFGTERRGISDRTRDRADLVVRIPMRDRVSSLNLATAVAVAVYARPGRLRRR